MIEIIESKPPLKISGQSSFIIKPLQNFDQRVVDTIKQLPFCYYHQKNRIWEIPENEIGELLDSLVLLDDIKFTVAGDSKPDQFRQPLEGDDWLIAFINQH